MAINTERKLSTTTHHGEEKSWNFKNCVTIHKEQHNIVESLQDYGYKMIDQFQKPVI